RGGHEGESWLASFFSIFTIGELFVSPIGLGLFARLAPAKSGATTVAAWYLAIFSGSSFAGLVGGSWSSLDRSSYFASLAVIATVAAGSLRSLDQPIRRIDLSQSEN
ncbi:hypothetical protein OY671_012663, partial [Metschnikowia pulcherrima]